MTHRQIDRAARATRIALLTLAAFLPATGAASAALISYAPANTPYSQNFDTLANSPNDSNVAWADGTTLPGWFLNVNGSVPATYKVNNGTVANTLGFHSNGATGAIDRALGTQTNSTASTAMRIGVAFSNDYVTALRSFTVTYDGEHWRRISNEGADDYIVEYQIFNAGLGSVNAGGTWTAVPALTFVTPTYSIAGTTQLDGNAAANRVAGITATISDIYWNPGQELWIRFTDTPPQHQLAVDNFLFSASVPEPSTLAMLLGLAAVGVLGWFQRRRS